MCSIAGMFVYDQDAMGTRKYAVKRMMRSLIGRAKMRGRDSAGISICDSQGGVFTSRNSEGFSRGWAAEAIEEIDVDTVWVMANLRAEPTTEYVEDKNEFDCQPYNDGPVYVIHNGTIANDAELREEFEIHTRTAIDSAVLPSVMRWSQVIDGIDLSALLKRGKIKGSYAMAIADARATSRMLFATNYKPLYFLDMPDLGVVFFSSQREHLLRPEIDVLEQMLTDRRVEFDLSHSPVRCPPYTVVELRKVGHDSLASSRISIDPPHNRDKVLVVCSGGLDSTVVASVMRAESRDFDLLHFSYGCRAGEKERDAVQEIAQHFGVEAIFIDTEMFKKFAPSVLTDADGEISKGQGGAEGAEFAHEWVPARNLVMLAVATAVAEANGYGVIALGANLEEAGAYPDNEMEFYNLFSDLLPYAVHDKGKVDVEAPLGNMMKHEIVRLGMDILAPMELTWSCYKGGEKHCGECGPCFMRKTAFEMNGSDDPVFQ